MGKRRIFGLSERTRAELGWVALAIVLACGAGLVGAPARAATATFPVPDEFKQKILHDFDIGGSTTTVKVTKITQGLGLVTVEGSIQIASRERGFYIIYRDLGLLNVDINSELPPVEKEIFPAESAANTSSRDPFVVGYSSEAFTPYHAFRYDTTTDTQLDLGTLDPSNSNAASFGEGVSDDGSVVVGFSDFNSGATQHGFRWTQSDLTMHDLGSAIGAAGYSRALGVSGDGSVIVGDSDFDSGNIAFPTTRHAFRWTSGSGFDDLGYLGASNLNSSLATAITMDGSVIVGQASTGSNASHAFRWTATDNMVDIGALSGDTSAAATAVSDSGKVVVGISAPRPLTFSNLGFDYGTDTHAFRWTGDTGIKDLTQLLTDAGVDMTGMTLVAATGVSGDGQYIAGAATTPNTAGNETAPFILQYCDDAVDACTTAVTTPSSVSTSIASVAGQQNTLANNIGGTADGLLGFNQPLGGNSELGGFGAAGSFTLGSSGRFDLTGNTALIGGIAYTQQSYSGVDVTSAALAAAGLRYTKPAGHDLAAFIEGGGWLAPTMDMTFTRTYANGAGTATGTGSTTGTLANLYARAGVVWTPQPTREIGLAATVGHTWTTIAGYAEASGSSNPFPATFADRSGGTSFVKAQAEWTEALTSKWDMTLSAAIGRTFGATGTVSATVTGIGRLGHAGRLHLCRRRRRLRLQALRPRHHRCLRPGEHRRRASAAISRSAPASAPGCSWAPEVRLSRRPPPFLEHFADYAALSRLVLASNLASRPPK